MKARIFIGISLVIGLLFVSTWVAAADTGFSVALQKTNPGQPSLDLNMEVPILHPLDKSGDMGILDENDPKAISSQVPGWEQVNDDGFGDPGNSVVASLTVYSDTLFAGTGGWETGAQLWQSDSGSSWTAVITDGFGSLSNQGIDHMIEFKNQLYAGTWADETGGGEVWRSSNGMDWTRVVSQGFGTITNTEVFRFAVFSDTLYASAWNRPEGGTLWYSASGDAGDWHNANLPWDANNIAATGLDPYNDYLYAGTYNQTTGGQVWRTSDGTSWSQVNTDGFGQPENDAIASFAFLNGYLYAGTRNYTNGGQIWRCTLCDGSDWSQVVDAGFGNLENWGVVSLIVFENQLYGFTGNNVTGIQAWRSSDGNSWEQVGFSGFGDSGNYRPYWDNSAAVFDDRLYIGTYNSITPGEIWRILDFAQATVDPEVGGTFTHTDTNTTTISIPPEAVTETILLQLTPAPTVTVPVSFSIAGQAFNLDAYIDGLHLPDYSFLTPITVTLHYNDTDLVGLDEHSLTLYYWNGSGWIDAACGPYDRHPDQNWLSAPICHLSEFAWFGLKNHLNYLPVLIK